MITQGCRYGSESGDLKEGLKEGDSSRKKENFNPAPNSHVHLLLT